MKSFFALLSKIMLVSAFVLIIALNAFSTQKEKRDSLFNLIKLSKSDTAKMSSYFMYASFLKYENPDTALFYVKRAMTIAKKRNDEKFIMKANNELGIIYWYKGEYKKAQILLAEAFRAGEKFQDTAVLISSRYNIGNINVTQGNYEAAKVNFNMVLKFIGTSDSVRIAQTLSAIGNIYLYQSDYLRALEYYTNSANILELKNSNKDLALTYNNIGIIYYYQEQFEKALNFYQKSLEIKESIGDKKGMCDCYNNIAIIYDELDNSGDAYKFYNKAIDLLKELGIRQGLASTYSNLADLEQKNKNYVNSEKLYNEALKIQIEINDKRGQAYSQIGIGGLYYYQNKLDEALEVLKKAIIVAHEINAKRELLNAYEKIKDIYIEQKEYQQATNYYKLISRLEKEVYNVERLDKLNDIQSRYETKAKEKEIEILKANKRLRELELKQKDIEVNKQKTLTQYLSIGFGVFIVFMIIIIRLYFGKRKTNKILIIQKEEISQQKEELMAQSELLTTTNKALEKKNIQITDSINYAKKIQFAIIPEIDKLNNDLIKTFAFFKPKDIVSGDFYWHTQVDNYIFIAVVDCTGHGVPGAFMSIIGNNLLNEIIVRKQITNPSDVLYNMDIGVRNMLMNNLSEDRLQDDGMEISLCRIDTNNKQILISCSNQNVLIYYNNEVQEIEGCSFSIGGIYMKNKVFQNREFNIDNESIVYLFTDGFSDQFGGEKNKKYGSVRFHEFIKKISNEEFEEQSSLIEKEFIGWKRNNYQIDDVCVLGIKV